MQKRSSKKKLDLAQLAKSIVDQATAETPPAAQEQPPDPLAAPLTPDGKNAAAVALGRLGGLKGGKARAASLSKKKRSEIAKKAAAARWKKKEG